MTKPDRVIRRTFLDDLRGPQVYRCRLTAEKCWQCGAVIESAQIHADRVRFLSAGSAYPKATYGPARVVAVPCEHDLRLDRDFVPLPTRRKETSMNKEDYPRCKTCRWWSGGKDTGHLRSICRCIENSGPINDRSGATASGGSQGADIFTGPAYGCVHHEALPEPEPPADADSIAYQLAARMKARAEDAERRLVSLQAVAEAANGFSRLFALNEYPSGLLFGLRKALQEAGYATPAPPATSQGATPWQAVLIALARFAMALEVDNDSTCETKAEVEKALKAAGYGPSPPA